jgi:hypothetical protein
MKIKRALKILVLGFLCVSHIEAQLPVDSVGRVVFRQTVLVDSCSKTVLYDRARAWAARTYRTIQLQDSEAGRIIAIGTHSISVESMLGTALPFGFVRHTLTIDIKDGRYRYTFTDFEHEYPTRKDRIGGVLEREKPQSSGMTGTWKEIKKQTFTNINQLINELKKEMSKIDNW